MKNSKLVIRVLLVVALLSTPPAAMVAQIIIKSTEDSYTYMAEDTITHNDATLRVRTALPSQVTQTTFRNAYIKFDLRSGFSGTIATAKLVLGLERALINTPGSVNKADFYSVTDDSWQWSTITWKNAPAKGVRLLSYTFAARSNTAPDTSFVFDVTNYVKQEYAGDKIISFCITEDSLQGPDIRFNSSRSTKVGPPPLVTTPQLIITGAATDVENGRAVVPVKFELEQNYPNPFNPTTVISFQLPSQRFVRLIVFDLLGRKMATLVSEERGAGTHKVIWDSTDSQGNPVPSGVYVYRLSVADLNLQKKMLLLR